MLDYIKKLISKDEPERIKAFLALLAGVFLCVGFSALLIAVIFGKAISSFITVNAALVTLATFSKD